MNTKISNIVFSMNRPLQLDAYLRSLHKFMGSGGIKTYVIYKAQKFSTEYRQVFSEHPNCIGIEESDFHTDVISLLRQVESPYVLFGIDDVVFFDSVDVDVITGTFEQYSSDIFGFSLRFSPQVLADTGDIINSVNVNGQAVYSLDWTRGKTATTRYPFELCSTVYRTELVRQVISGSVNNNKALYSFFSPGSLLMKSVRKIVTPRKILKSLGYFYSPNTFESWNCRWCQRHSDNFPPALFFQKLCCTAIQVNMVNTTTKPEDFSGPCDYTVEHLNEKYKQGYRFDIDFLVNNKPSSTHSYLDSFKLIKK